MSWQIDSLEAWLDLSRAGSCGSGQASITAQAHAFVASGLSELLSKASWQPTFWQVARQGGPYGLDRNMSILNIFRPQPKCRIRPGDYGESLRYGLGKL